MPTQNVRMTLTLFYNHVFYFTTWESTLCDGKDRGIYFEGDCWDAGSIISGVGSFSYSHLVSDVLCFNTKPFRTKDYSILFRKTLCSGTLDTREALGTSSLIFRICFGDSRRNARDVWTLRNVSFIFRFEADLFRELWRIIRGVKLQGFEM